MAPRGRRAKKNVDTRMDAAIETMKVEYGISDVELVKKVLKELLDAYGGGEEAWYFIELYTYQELFEAIVRSREENQEQNNLLINSAGGGDPVKALIVENSLQVAENDAPDNATGLSSVAAVPFCSAVAEGAPLKFEEIDGKGSKDIGLDLLPPNAQLTPKTPVISSVASRPRTSLLLHSPSLTTTDSAPFRRHWPCYGWIEDDDEEEINDFIDLRPAKAAARRRSRWDLKPEDPDLFLVHKKEFRSGLSNPPPRPDPTELREDVNQELSDSM